MPGLVAAKLGAQTILTDVKNALENCRRQCELNQLNGIKVVELAWGNFDSIFDIPQADVVLAADCFYDPKGFLCNRIELYEHC